MWCEFCGFWHMRFEMPQRVVRHRYLMHKRCVRNAGAGCCKLLDSRFVRDNVALMRACVACVLCFYARVPGLVFLTQQEQIKHHH